MKPTLILACISLLLAGRHVMADSSELDREAIRILTQSCASCHGDGNEKHGNIDFITDKSRLLSSELIKAGDADSSLLFIRMIDAADPMPPNDAPEEISRPSKTDIAKVREWIESLDNEPKNLPGETTSQTPITVPTAASLHKSILEFLATKPAASQAQWRFFSFTNIAQLKGSAGARNKGFQKIDMGSHRAALAKAVNSLHWRADVAFLEPVGADELVLAIDLNELWNRESRSWSEDKEWLALLQEYPYGIVSQSNDFREIQRLTKSQIPIIRADWFIATALRPPLYHDLLGIPLDVAELEAFLSVEVNENILSGTAYRSGFTESGVSKNANRLIERHFARFGYYIKSYDFLPGAHRGNIIQFPTGPEFEGNPFAEKAFIHDGGEIIFSLPNGLQGYMLATGDGRRIDAGPAELVSDDKRVSGSPLIVNGISCIACHRHGIYPFPKDEVLQQSPVAGEIRAFIASLHDSEKLERLTNGDRDRYLAALGKVIGPWLTGPDRSQLIVTSLPEPITPVARFFANSELGLAEIAAEIGVESEQSLAERIKNDPQLQAIGLSPLISGGVVKRDDWQRIASGPSKFQQTTRLMDLGVPITVLKPTKNQ